MKIAKEYHKDIFCLEGDWEKDLRIKMSIRSTLDYLNDCFSIKSIHRNCSVREQFIKYLKEYPFKKYYKYSILYLAFHGDPNTILFGKDLITLDEIAEICENRLSNKIVHFGSCSALNLDKRLLKNFIRKTNALCISGYNKKVDFNQSTVLDILYLEMWQSNKDVRSVERKMNTEYKGLIKRLGFRMVYV
ncbi:MAG: hypothetical protein JW973_18600 [Bacteroidales bacterium]|nr:hypothetical protein [Bacteroidales bacterium]